MAVMGLDNIATLAADPSSVALKPVKLKGIYPGADISSMVARLVLQDDLEDMAAAAGNVSCPLLWSLLRCSHPLH